MPAPVVQSLDQILADLSPAYAGQEAVVGQQRAALPGKYDTQISGLDATKTGAFRDINAGAQRRGLAFSGIPIAEQTRYVGEKYLPAIAGLKSQQNTEDLSLAATLASLEGDKAKTALGTRQSQEKSLSDYNTQQELIQQQQAFDRWKIQNDQQFQTTMANLKAANDRSLAGYQASLSKSVDPLQEFGSYISSQFQKAGGQGNKGITRQAQDAWANAWLDSKGVTGAARNAYWNYFNTTYNRSNDPTKDPRYKR